MNCTLSILWSGRSLPLRALTLGAALVLTPAFAATTYGAPAAGKAAATPARPNPQPVTAPQPGAARPPAASLRVPPSSAEERAGGAEAAGPAEEAPPSVLTDRPEEAADSELLGPMFEGRAAGISLRPPAQSKALRKTGDEIVEFVNEDRKWTMKVTRMALTQPMTLTATTHKGQVRHGLLEVTLDRLLSALPGATVLRDDVVNIGDGGAPAGPRRPGQPATKPNVGMIAIRYTNNLENLLSQQAIIQANERLYYLISLTTPASKDFKARPADAKSPQGRDETEQPEAPERPEDPGERLAVDTFQQVLDSVRLLDRAALKGEQDQRLWQTKMLFTNLDEERLRAALKPQQWFRLVRDGKDIGYLYTVEEIADGIPGRQRPAAGRGKGKLPQGVLIGSRSRTLPGEAVEVEAESWLFVEMDRKNEHWSAVTLVKDDKAKTSDHVLAFGSSNRRISRALNEQRLNDADWMGARDRLLDSGELTALEEEELKQPPITVKEHYLLDVTHVSKEDTEPVSQELSPWYLPQALGHLLPRLLPLHQPRQYLFGTYVNDARAVMLRYVDVLPEGRADFAGQSVRAVRVVDRIGLEGSATVHFMSPDGEYLGSENEDSKITILPTDEETLKGLWKNADLTRPGDLDHPKDTRVRPQKTPPAAPSGRRPGLRPGRNGVGR